MSLSATDAKEQITTYQALLDIAKAIKQLAANPNLEQLSKDAFTLPKRDQQRAELAKTEIAKYEALITKSQRIALENASQQDDIDKRKGEIEAASKVIDAKNRALDDREDIVKKKELLTVDGINKLAEGRKALFDDQAKLDKARLAFEAKVRIFEDRERTFEDKQAESKARADEIKRLSEGL